MAKASTGERPPRPPTPIARRNVIPALVSAIACVTIVGIGLSLTMTLLALRLAAQGFSAHAIGLNPTAGGFAVLAGAAFVPALARRINIKPLLLLALLVAGLSLLSFTLTNDYWAWLAMRAVFAGALSILFRNYPFDKGIIPKYLIRRRSTPCNLVYCRGINPPSTAISDRIRPIPITKDDDH